MRPELHAQLRRALRPDVPVRRAEQQLLDRRLEDVFGVSGVGNLFKPGTLDRAAAEFRQLSEGERAYPMDWNNIAPSVGIAWTPSASSGWLPPADRRDRRLRRCAPATADPTRASG